MTWLSKWMASTVARSTRIDYEGVAHTPQAYLAVTPQLTIIKKYLHKFLRLKLARQLPLWRQEIPFGAKILWLYTGKRNIGDATMDLSGRALLKDKISAKNITIDLFTLPNLQTLFAQDDVFRHVYSDLAAVKTQEYDFIVLSEFNLPSIRLKSKHFKSLPFVCIFGFFFGPDRNQTCFSYAAVNAIFKCHLSPQELSDCAKPYLNADQTKLGHIGALVPQSDFLTLSVGGLDADRTYQSWPAFLQLLDRAQIQNQPTSLVLIGADNGRAASEAILAAQYSQLHISSLVGKLSLLETRAVIAKSTLFIGCDGGLMHVAHSTSTPSITLFRHTEAPHLRLTKQCNSTPIHSAQPDVNAIAPEAIFKVLRDWCVASQFGASNVV